MGIRKYIQISIVFSDAVNLPVPPTQKQTHHLRIRLLELSATNSSHWEMSVSEFIRENREWTAILSTEESQQLSTLLRKIPAENMVSESGMLDGAETEMLVIHNGIGA